MSNDGGQRDLLKPLTSFRFFAALMVFAWHTLVDASTWHNYQIGSAGVSFFFVLSGFILTYKYFPRLRNGQRFRPRHFYAARVAKLLPVHLLTFALAVPLIAIGLLGGGGSVTLHLLGKAAANLLLLQSFIPNGNYYYSFNTVTWSISDELFFYGLFPAIIGLIAVSWRRFGRRTVVALLAGLWLMALIGVSILGVVTHGAEYYVYIFPVARLLDFLTGIVLALIYLHAPLPTLSRRVATGLELAGLGLAVGAIAALPAVPLALRYSIFLLPVWSLLIYLYSHQRGRISDWLSRGWLVFLGEISFSFYMVHFLIVRYLRLTPLSGLVLVGSALVLSILAASLIHLTYEEPLRRQLAARLAG